MKKLVLLSLAACMGAVIGSAQAQQTPLGAAPGTTPGTDKNKPSSPNETAGPGPAGKAATPAPRSSATSSSTPASTTGSSSASSSTTGGSTSMSTGDTSTPKKGRRAARREKG